MQVRKQAVEYYNNAIYWYFNRKKHRDVDLPAVYFIDGKLYSIFYYQHGNRHRITGPAIISYKRKIKEYFYQDKEYGSLEEVQMVEACR